MQTDVTITNDDNAYTYLFRGVGNWNIVQLQPVIEIPFINNTSENNKLFRFTGQNMSISFNFPLMDSSDDLADGTFTSTVKTIDEQVAYLLFSNYWDPDFDISWTLTQSVYIPSGKTGVIENISLQQDAGSPEFVRAGVSFKIGTFLALS